MLADAASILASSPSRSQLQFARPPTLRNRAKMVKLSEKVYISVNSMLSHKGSCLTIRYCEQPPDGTDQGAWEPESWRQALRHIPVGKHDRCRAEVHVRLDRLAKEGRLRSPDYFRKEGKLPDGKHFYAVKAGKVRAYGWFSKQHKSVFYVSHFAFKKGGKLTKEDANKVKKNWRRIEKNESEV
jgi:hypothetical protein